MRWVGVQRKGLTMKHSRRRSDWGQAKPSQSKARQRRGEGDRVEREDQRPSIFVSATIKSKDNPKIAKSTNRSNRPTQRPPQANTGKKILKSHPPVESPGAGPLFLPGREAPRRTARRVGLTFLTAESPSTTKKTSSPCPSVSHRTRNVTCATDPIS